MKTNRIIQLAAGVLLLTACTSDIYEEYVNGRVPINLGYEVLTAEESTRTAASTTLNDATIASGDNITVKIKNNGADASAYNPYNYTAGDGGAMTPPSPKPYYPTESTNIDILAYYPANAASNFDVAADQTTDDNYKASDLMVATVTNQARTTSTVALAFQHKMAKLVVTATAGDGVNTIQTITLKNVKRRVTFTNTSGAVGSATTISGSTDVTLFKSGTGTSGTGAALIPAQTIEGDVIAIETDQGTAVYNVPAGKAFTANTKYTITVTVNRTAVGAVNSITWGSSASLTIQPTVEVTKNQYPLGLPGLFSVSATEKVCFSQGNLQYQASTGTWRFAENQYDYVGNGTNGNVTGSTNASISSSYDGWIDLFGWATSGYNSKNPYMTSTTDADYGPSISSGEWTTDSESWDWGVYNAISNGGNTANSGWRTLTGGSGGEWEYLFNTRTTATTNMPTGTNSDAARYTKAKVAGVPGVILFPDNYAHPAGVTVTVSDAAYNKVDKAYTTFAVDADNWVTMQSAGCVFLPAAGRRNGTSVFLVGSGGNYWSSTANGTDYAYGVYFYSGEVSPALNVIRHFGFSVRLVRPAWYKGISSATSSDIGKIICSNGHIHTNVSDVTCGGTPQAMIAYVGTASSCSHGLAIALADASTSCTWDNAASTVSSWAGSHSVSGGTWRLPSGDDWMYMFQACGGSTRTTTWTDGMSYSYGNFRTKLKALNSSYDVQSSAYWSSKEYGSGYAWYYNFGYSLFDRSGTFDDIYVRAVLAF